MKILNFKPITIGDREAFQQPFADYGFLSCEYSFANFFMWGEIYEMEWCDFLGYPLVNLAGEKVLYFPLSPEVNVESLVKLSKAHQEQGGTGGFFQTPRKFVEKTPELNSYFEICEDRNFADYLHLSSRLAGLSGKKLRKKRNLISQFERNHLDYKDLPLTSELFESCLELTKKNMDPDNPEHEEELDAIQKGFANFAELGLGGRVVVFRAQTVAFSVFSKSLDGAYLIHYEKFDYDFKGASQVVDWKTAEFLQDKCEYINREQDLNIPGLRKAKLSYDPDVLLINYSLIPK